MQMERQLRAGGGLMTLEEPRQGFFLGKIVKKAKRAVKKVVKSPIGKAAMLGAIGFGIPGTQIGGLFGRASFGGGVTGLLGKRGIAATLPSIFGVPMGPPGTGSPGILGSLVSKFKALPLGQKALLGLGAAGVIAPFLMGGGDEEEEEPDTPFSVTPDSIANIVAQARNRDASLRFLPKPQFVDNFYRAADGGLADIPRQGYKEGESVLSEEQMAMITNMKKRGMDLDTIASMTDLTKDQVNNYLSSLNKKQEGGIMDLGGMEKDYREGGFVPIGAEERADDVPARLSKNEFVFTADAVRNAGGGDIDEGARVMQNMMDNLEAGGTISEESQGMNPAQEMFDQAQMMEGRLA